MFIMLYKVAITFKSVDEPLVCDQSNETYSAEQVGEFLETRSNLGRVAFRSRLWDRFLKVIVKY